MPVLKYQDPNTGIWYPLSAGEMGPPGDDGPPGPEGDSAYQTWLDEGNTGTEQDFLDSLMGAPGTSGLAILEASWNYNATNFVGPPAVGQIRFNNANPGIATQMFISEVDRQGTDRTVEMDLAAAAPGAYLYVRDSNGAFAKFTVPSAGTDHGTWRTTPLVPLAGNPTSLRTAVWVTIVDPDVNAGPPGPPGEDGESGIVVVEHGTVGSTARPVGAVVAYWIGSATPANALPYDFWKDS